jgi:predicted transcriptional regulator
MTGEEIKAYRMERGLSQRALAKEWGISQQRISALEQGMEDVRVPDERDDTIRQLRAALRVCQNELCLRCGEYKRRHKGACEGCRWEKTI